MNDKEKPLPLLSEWRVDPMGHAHGIVFRDSRFPDGEAIATSRVVKIITASGTVYEVEP